jgi:hypothetical protein
MLAAFQATRTVAAAPATQPVVELTAPAASPAWAFASDTFDLKSLLGMPPAADSEIQHSEIEQILQLQANRTDADVKRITVEDTATVFVFSEALGSWFNEKNLPATNKTMGDVYAQIKAQVTTPGKAMFGRPRPPLADARIHPCLPLEKSAAFPSAHATRFAAWAALIGNVFPDRAADVKAIAHRVGTDRVLAGEHFPSDVAAGEKLGEAIAAHLLADANFQSDIGRVKAECRAAQTALGTSTASPADSAPVPPGAPMPAAAGRGM